MKFLLSFLVSLVVIFGFSPSASALSCAQPPEKLLDRAEVIFLGIAEEVYTSTTREDEYVRFSVLRYWKGEVSSSMKVYGIRSWNGMADGTIFYQKGATYVVFAYKYPEGTTRLRSGVDCGSTSRVHDAQNDQTIIALDKEKGSIPTTTTTSGVYAYARNLTLGSTGADVVALQTFLEQKSFLVMPQGILKGYFGQLTRNAVKRYQESKGIAPALGFFGPITRASVQAE